MGIKTYRPRYAVPTYKPRPPIGSERRTDKQFYDSTAWRKCRKAYLGAHPLCVDCERKGKLTPATEVHHVTPRKQDDELAFAWANFEGLCKSCHSRKTRRENASTDRHTPMGEG
jgi:5-methylcytosine-specific restriction protein A